MAEPSQPWNGSNLINMGRMVSKYQIWFERYRENNEERDHIADT